jgi:hypothetical protein
MPVPAKEVVARMTTGQPVIHGEAWSHEDPNQYVTRRYWARVSNIYGMLDTFGAAGCKGILDQLVTLDDGYTNKIRNLEPLTQNHIKQAPFYFLVPGALEHMVTEAENVTASPAHPLTARLPQESLRDDPTGRWANFQTSSTDHRISPHGLPTTPWDRHPTAYRAGCSAKTSHVTRQATLSTTTTHRVYTTPG